MKGKGLQFIGRAGLVWAGLVVGAMLGVTGIASASSISYSFEAITSNNPADAATGGQYAVEVSDAGTSVGGNALVSFVFSNDGPAQSVITGIYFYDGALLGATMSIGGSHPDVNFSPGGSPPQLPGGNDYGLPNPTVAFNSTANNPPPGNGINNTGQWLEIVFELEAGKTYADVIASIESGVAMPFNQGTDLVIGIHVQGFDGGGSESFVLIPLPAPVWMGLAGLVGVIALRRRVM